MRPDMPDEMIVSMTPSWLSVASAKAAPKVTAGERQAKKRKQMEAVVFMQLPPVKASVQSDT